MKNNAARVLVYRLGSLGDTVVALPALRLVKSYFAYSRIALLTNFSVSLKAAPMEQIISGMDLFDKTIHYKIASRSFHELATLIREIRNFGPDTLVYLSASRGKIKLLRDYLFFRLCGIRKIIGMPWQRDLATAREIARGSFEHESQRLLRCISDLGGYDLSSPEAFSLELSDLERSAFSERFGVCMSARFFVASIGAKADVKDWGDNNWQKLFALLSEKNTATGLVLVGSADEFDRSEKLLSYWSGPSKNLCGSLTVRETALLLTGASFFIGHDSGPMHLAAAVGKKCYAIFSSRNLPGQWFPFGAQHRVFYTDLSCRGCNLDFCAEFKKKCIMSIKPEAVAYEVLKEI